MAQLKILGSESRLRSIFCLRWPDVKVSGGHTAIAFTPGTTSAAQARDIYASLIVEHSFTPLDTTTPDAPAKAPRQMPEEVTTETEFTFIPQYAGG